MQRHCRFFLSSLILFVCFLCAGENTSGQNSSSFQVNHYTVVFSGDILSWKDQNIQGEEPKLILLSFNKILSTAEKNLLQDNQIILEEYLGSNLYSAKVSARSSFAAVYPFISGVSLFLPEYKIAPSIQAKASNQKNISILVSFFKDITPAEISSFIGQSGATLVPDRWQKKGLYKLEIVSADLKSFASFYGLKYISEPAQNIALDLDGKGAEAAILLNLPNALGGKGLSGKNVMIGHGDNCSGIYHIDQRDRVINYNNADITRHGVAVNGLIAGDGISDPAGQGIAPDGTCISLFFDAVLLLKEDLYKGFNATLTNNSYAAIVGDCSNAGVYDALSQNLDEMAFALPEQLDVFAAGNDGEIVCGPYPAGYYNVCGGFQTAKNVLTVGSCFRDYTVSSTSSRGPLRDGRLKPEITAAGANVYCAVPDNAYTYASGTSFACPQTVGVLALLTERYRQLHSNANPQSDLLKAIAINGASDLGRPGPDYWYGFGFLNGVRSLGIIENNWYTSNKIASGDAAKTFSISVPANTAQLKVLMYYHDPVASASSTTQLINDIDLTVAEPGGSVVHRPLVLNPSVASVGNNATEGVDHLNNVEQVTINNPAAGTYTASVSDFAIPQGPQSYVLAYDIVPDELHLLFPMANASAPASTDMYIYWNAPADAVNTTKVEFSQNAGTTWSTIATAVPANTRFYQWAVPVINSNQCKIRITRGSKSDESGLFIINQQAVATLSAAQCPGSVAIDWTNVPVATKYYMLLKKGAHFQKVDSVNAGTLSYTFKGLHTNEDYFVSVLPAIGTMDGFRSKAVKRRPDNGTCTNVADGDLAIDAIIAPESGRRFTSTALTTNTELKVNIRNQDDARISDYNIAYKVNSGAWKTLLGFNINANTSGVQLVDLVDFSDTIEYTITVAVKNNDRPDPVSANDTVVKVIRHIPNRALSLISPVFNDFESLSDLTLLKDTIGLTKDGFWDYSNSNDTGRLRSRIPGSKLVKTDRSVSMDVNMNVLTNVNYFTGTFNLSNYDTTADELRFDFDYEMRGMPVLKDSNKVWVRGSDKDIWITAFQYSNSLDTAKLHTSGSLSLRDLLRSKKQNFSGSTQIRFGQFDSTLIVDDSYGGGITIDNVNLYKVSKDLQLTSVLSPGISNCDISSAPMRIRIKNGTTNAMSGISVAYTIDGSSPVNEFIAGPIAGGDSLDYTFTKGLSALGFGAHSINTWLHVAGDDFLKNDTINSYGFYIAPLLSNFPYLENFEASDGGWHAGGRNSSWAYGVPAGTKISRAASGTKAWKTNLKGNYNTNEQSYLISPCINTSGLTQPTLSFSTAFDVENCDAGCDKMFVEYSDDNELTWVRLGTSGSGTNWYNNAAQYWNGAQTRWHVASSTLPIASQLKLRIGLISDLGTNLEGIAIDDIHIYDLKQNIVAFGDKDFVAADPMPVSGTAWFYCTEKDKVLLAIDPLGNDLGVVNSTVFRHHQYADPVNRQYFMPRNFVVHPDKSITSDALLRLYISDEEVNLVWSDTSCKTCSRAEDIYRTGITQYRNTVSTEDSSLLNNQSGLYNYYPYSKVKWVPYDNGYYAEFTTNATGEYWLNDGGILGTLPVNTEYVRLSAKRTNDQDVQLDWICLIDTQMNDFLVERSFDSLNFTTVTDIKSLKSLTGAYNQGDKPNAAENSKVYYRLFCTTTNAKTFYSNTVAVDWSKGDQLLAVYPVPSADGVVSVRWTGAVGSVAAYKITDLTGKLLLESELKSTSWTNTQTLQLNYLAKGMYFFSIQIGSNKYLEKLIFK